MRGSTYNEQFKKSAVQKLLRPGSLGLNATAASMGIPSSTLYTWKLKYAKLGPMSKSKKNKEWSPEAKLDAVIKTATMSEQELGEFLRANGLHSSELENFKTECLPTVKTKGRPKLDPEIAELRTANKRLSKDLRRKDAALSEYAARVVLLKKSHEIWGTKEDDE